ncbi:MAG: hypothetical protein ACK5SX_00260, partial [Sandaracinobacter sp.]
MSGHHHEMAIPKQALWGATGLVLVALVGTIAVRIGLLPEVANPRAMRSEAQATVLKSRDLQFLDLDGNVVV